jgi:hypothetical protein
MGGSRLSAGYKSDTRHKTQDARQQETEYRRERSYGVGVENKEADFSATQR